MWHLILPFIFVLANVEWSHGLASSTVNTNILTMFSYENHYIYIYGAVTNQHDNLRFPERWSFYYVPIAMIPVRRSSSDGEPSVEWLTMQDNRIRMKILLGNDEISKLAREAIVRKFPANMTQISKSWDVSPLMIDALTVSIVESGTNEVISDVNEFEVLHPSSLSVSAIITCSSKELAQNVLKKVLNEEYDIEVAFHFAGFRQISTRTVSVSSSQVKEVFKKTVAEGGSTISKYILRSQLDQFAEDYLKNVRVVIYSEKGTKNVSNSLVDSLMERFVTLIRKGMMSMDAIRSREVWKVKQIWSNKDLQPDVITNGLHDTFTYNEVETRRNDYRDMYFNVKEDRYTVDKHTSGWKVNFLFFSVGHTKTTYKQSFMSSNRVEHLILNLTTIKHYLSQTGVHVEWEGQKWKPKSFSVFRLTEVSKILEDSLFAKVQTSEKKTGAIIRKLLWLHTTEDFHKVFKEVDVNPYRLGKVWLYAGSEKPPLPWLLCDGRAVSRTQFEELFKVIGDKYGSGDGKTTFNLPDLRSRLPLGADPTKVNSDLATHLGRIGGKYVHVMNSNELPRHSHEKGSLSLSPGATHTHDIIDGGHNHGGRTAEMPGSHSVSESGLCLFDKANRVGEHYHSIPRDHSNITILDSGDHSHKVTGNSGSVGSNKPINVVGPYQVIQHIIYSGQYS